MINIIPIIALNVIISFNNKYAIIIVNIGDEYVNADTIYALSFLIT